MIFLILIRVSVIFQWLSLLFSKEVFCKLPKNIKNRLNEDLGNPTTVGSAPFSFDVIINGTLANPSVSVSAPISVALPAAVPSAESSSR